MGYKISFEEALYSKFASCYRVKRACRIEDRRVWAWVRFADLCAEEDNTADERKGYTSRDIFMAEKQRKGGGGGGGSRELLNQSSRRSSRSRSRSNGRRNARGGGGGGSRSMIYDDRPRDRDRYDDRRRDDRGYDDRRDDRRRDDRHEDRRDREDSRDRGRYTSSRGGRL